MGRASHIGHGDETHFSCELDRSGTSRRDTKGVRRRPTSGRVAAVALATTLSVLLSVGCSQNPFFGVQEITEEDEDAPEITIVSPDDGQVVSGRLLISGYAEDEESDIEQVDVRIDGDSWESADGTANWSYRLDTTLFAEGPLDIEVRAIDEVGNEGTVGITVTVDQTVPSVNVDLDFGEYEHYIRGEDVTLSGTARDDNEVESVEISFDGGVNYEDAALELTESNGESAYEWSYTIDDTSKLIPGDGELEIRLRAIDDADLIGTAAFTLFIDNTPPEVSLDRPEEAAHINANEDGEELTVQGTDENAIGRVRRVAITIDTHAGNTIEVDTDSERASLDADGRYSAEIDIDGIRNDGDATISAVAVDRAGNTSDPAEHDVVFDANVPAFLPEAAPEIRAERDERDGDGTETVTLDGDLGSTANNFREEEITVSGEAYLQDEIGDTFTGEWKIRKDGEKEFDYQSLDEDPTVEDDGTEWETSIDFAAYMPGTVDSYPEGELMLVVRLENEHGREAIERRDIRFDPVVPEIVIDNPSDLVGPNDTVAVDGTITNKVDGADVSLDALYFAVYETDKDSFDPDDPGSTFYGPRSVTDIDETDQDQTSFRFEYSWETGPGIEEGQEYVLHVTGTDLAGNPSDPDGIQEVEGDPHVPSVTIDEFDHPETDFVGSFDDSSTLSGKATIFGTAEAAEDFEIDTLQVGLSEGGGFVDTPEQPDVVDDEWEYLLDLGSDEDEGDYTLKARVEDDEGRVVRRFQDFTVDNTPGPDVAIDEPRDGAVISGDSEVFVGTTSNGFGMLTVEIRIEEGDWESVSGTTSWHHSLNISDLDEGQHEIAVRAQDEFLREDEHQITVEIDRTPPEVDVDLNFDDDEHYIRGEDVEISGTASDNTEVDRVQLSFDGGITYENAEDSFVKDEDGISHYTWTYTIDDTSALVDDGESGGLDVRLRAVDAAGLIGAYDGDTFPLNIDNIDPEVWITTPEESAFINADELDRVNMLTVAGDHQNDGVGDVAEVEIEINTDEEEDDPGPFAITEENGLGSDDFTIDIDIEDIRNAGAGTITAVATDRAGNVSETDQIDVIFDADPPIFLPEEEPEVRAERDERDGDETETVVLDGELGSTDNNFHDEAITLLGEAMLEESSDDEEIFGSWKVRDDDGDALFDFQDLDVQPTADDDDAEWEAAIDFAADMPGNDDSYPEGELTLVVRLENERGGYAKQERTVRLDRTAPEITIDDPSDDGEIGTAGTVTVDGSIDNVVDGDPVIVDRLEFVVYDQNSELFYEADDIADFDEDSFSYQWNTDDVGLEEDEEYTLVVEGADLAGNESDPDGESSVTVVDEFPSVSFDEYTTPDADGTSRDFNDDNYLTGSAVVRGEASAPDGYTVEKIEVGPSEAGSFIEDEDKGWPGEVDLENDFDPETGEWEYDLSGLDLEEGSYTLMARVTDDHEDSRTDRHIVDITVDETPPSLSEVDVSLTDESGAPYLHGTVEVTGTADDDASGVESVTLWVNPEDGGPDDDDDDLNDFSELGGLAEYAFTSEWDTQDLPTENPDGEGDPLVVGDFGLRIRATDRAGNEITEMYGPQEVRPYIESLSQSSAFLGDEGLEIHGNNLSGAAGDTRLTIGGDLETGGEVDMAAESSGELVFDIPNEQGELSSGPVVVTIDTGEETFDNVDQEAATMSLFDRDIVFSDDEQPRYPDATFDGTSLIYAYAYRLGPQDRPPHFYREGAEDHIAVVDGVRGEEFVRIANHPDADNDHIYVSQARDELMLYGTDDDFGDENTFEAELSDGNDASYNDIGVGSDGDVHMVYYDEDDLAVYYRRTDSDLEGPTEPHVIPGGDTEATWVSIFVEEEPGTNDPDLVHAVYVDDGDGSLQYAYHNTDDAPDHWTGPMTIQGTGVGNLGTDIAVDDDGAIHVTYYDSNAGDLMYGHAAGPGQEFTTEQVDGTGVNGWFPSIALDASGGIHITYFGFQPDEPRYAQRLDGEDEFLTMSIPDTVDMNDFSTSTATVLDGDNDIRLIYVTGEEDLVEVIYLAESDDE